MSSRPDGVALRVAGPGDASAIAQVQLDGWRAAYRGLIADAELDGLTVEAPEIRWQALLERGDSVGFTLVASEPDDRVVGFCSVTAARLEIAAIYVTPDRWRRGIGGLLLEETLRILVDAGWDEVLLWVFRDNAPARAFYAAHGFTPDGAEREERDLPAEIRLRRALAAC